VSQELLYYSVQSTASRELRPDIFLKDSLTRRPNYAVMRAAAKFLKDSVTRTKILDCERCTIGFYTVKKVSDFPVASQDVT
jgi:hypothetical protein